MIDGFDRSNLGHTVQPIRGSGMMFESTASNLAFTSKSRSHHGQAGRYRNLRLASDVVSCRIENFDLGEPDIRPFAPDDLELAPCRASTFASDRSPLTIDWNIVDINRLPVSEAQTSAVRTV